jgi:hypothetical protein
MSVSLDARKINQLLKTYAQITIRDEPYSLTDSHIDERLRRVNFYAKESVITSSHYADCDKDVLNELFGSIGVIWLTDADTEIGYIEYRRTSLYYIHDIPHKVTEIIVTEHVTEDWYSLLYGYGAVYYSHGLVDYVVWLIKFSRSSHYEGEVYIFGTGLEGVAQLMDEGRFITEAEMTDFKLIWISCGLIAGPTTKSVILDWLLKDTSWSVPRADEAAESYLRVHNKVYCGRVGPEIWTCAEHFRTYVDDLPYRVRSKAERESIDLSFFERGGIRRIGRKEEFFTE